MYLGQVFLADISCHKTGTGLIPSVSLFFHLSPRVHPQSFKLRKLDCRGLGKYHKFFNLPKYVIAVARNILNNVVYKCQDIVVDIATRYGMDGPEVESRWGQHFSDRSRCPPSLLHVGYRVFPMGKAARSWC